MHLCTLLVFCTLYSSACWCHPVSVPLRMKSASHTSFTYREEPEHLHFLLSYNSTLLATDKVQLVLNDRTIPMQPVHNNFDTWEAIVELPLTHMGAITSHACQRYFFLTDSKEVSLKEKRIPSTDYYRTTCTPNSGLPESDKVSTLFASAVLYTILIGYLYL